MKILILGDVMGNSGVIKKDFLDKYGGVQKWNSLSQAHKMYSQLIVILMRLFQIKQKDQKMGFWIERFSM